MAYGAVLPHGSEPCGAVDKPGCRDPGLLFGFGALFEAEAVAVHFEDVDMVGQPVEQCAGEALGAEHAGPFIEGKIGCDKGRSAFVALGEDFEQQLCPGWR